MKFIASALLLFCVLVSNKKIRAIQAAAIICEDESAPATPSAAENGVPADVATMHGKQAATTPPVSNDVKQFLQTVQCTLEKAKPWVETIEQEAKRFEETAKRVGAGLINNLSSFMESFLLPNPNTGVQMNGNTTVGSTAISFLSRILAAADDQNITATAEDASVALP